MTRGEAAERIKMILKECTADEDSVCYVTSDDADALDMAIKALQQETVSRESYDHEFFLRKELEVKTAKLEKTVETLEQEPCEDCISREQAKLAIRDRFKDLPSRVEINTILNELPSVTHIHKDRIVHDFVDKCRGCGKHKWIPCSERLPDKSGTYICNCVESDINHVTFIKWQSRYKRWDLNGRRTFWRVTAWKPIPEPYERRQE